uniref:Coiled-coil protein 142 C-terminal domain-containing protein n=1 Tax=Sander lucioperca TaxID=283035 RepID=A0A8C9YRH6_SANLU
KLLKIHTPSPYPPLSLFLPHQVCVKGLPAEGGVLLLPSSPSLQGHYTALRRLLEQRCLLLFVHEYTRRARLTAAYISRVSHLLEGQLKKPHLTPNQSASIWSSIGVGLGSLSQELRVHLNHWSCLFSKVQSDHYLRPALVQQTRLLAEIKQTLDLLGLQALVLMEHYVYVILSAIAQTELDSVPKEVLEDILTGTALYNQAVGEQRAQHSATQLRTAVLQQTHCSTMDSSLPKSFAAGHHPAAFSVKELMMVLAVHEANTAAKQLLCWASEQSYHTCPVHTNHESCACSENCVSQGARLSLFVSFSSSFGSSEKEETGGAEGTMAEPDCLRWPHSVQWLDLGQSLVFAELFGQYRTLLWTLCSKALWLQLHVPQAGSTAGSINLQDKHRGFQILHRISQASKDGKKIMSSHMKPCGSVHTACALTQSPMTATRIGYREPPLSLSLSLSLSLPLPPDSISLFPSRLTLQRQTVSLASATVQLSTVWVMSKAYQFLSSWSLNKFLLITQGDLKVEPDLTFSSLVLKIFSSDCKRMSGEIFEQTMPSAVHWRHSLSTGSPGSPSEYASVAAQTVIGQVLEGVAPLSDDARVQALSITMTAFMEAWMEHILKQKIKFSVQGALQLKHDFDSIRELIQSDTSGLSAELHQRLLSLRVFQQVDSAVECLLQQPPAKPYLQPRAWEPFTRCPTNSSRDSVDAAVGSSITNLRCMEGEDLTQADPSVVTTDLPPVALGVSQREWLDLRIHSSIRRWRLPGLPCLSKSEP